MAEYSIKQLREIGFNIEGIRHAGCFYWVDYVDEETETVYAFTLNNDCKVDFVVTYEELSTLSKFGDVRIYEYKEV